MTVLEKTEVLKTDVLVLGGGIAGCFAAIKARESGLDAVIVDKGHVGRSGLSPQMSGVLTYFDPEQDNYDDWYRECIEASEWLSDQDVLDGMIYQTTKCIRDMYRWGAQFQTEQGKFIRKQGVGHIHARNVLMYHGGLQLMSVVRGEVLRRGVRLMERVMATDLLTSDGEYPTKGRIVGAVGFNIRTGKFYIFQAKATIIATGSTRSVFLGPTVSTLSGDGRGMAFRSGAEVRNMDILKFSIYRPGGLTNPQGPGANILFGEGAILVNAQGEEFMQKWDQVRMGRAPRVVVAMAIAAEEREGRGPVYLDATHLDEAAHSRIEKCIPITVRSLANMGLDFRKDRIPYTVGLTDSGPGGVRVNGEKAATIPGLYAIGDASDFGEMGVTELITPGVSAAVGGYFAGEAAAKYTAEIEEPTVSEHQAQVLKEQLFTPMKRKSGLSHQEVREHCKDIIRRGLLGPLKSEKRLKEAIELAGEIRENEMPKLSARDYHELGRCIALGNELLFLELFPLCSLMRTESRGGHWREDYPQRDDTNWLKWVIAKKEDSGVKVWAESIPFDRYPLKP